MPKVDGASNSSSNHDCGIDSIDSLQNMIMKRHPKVLPSYLKSKKSWDNEMSYAYSIGLALGGAKNLVIRRIVFPYSKLIGLKVSSKALDLFLIELSNSVWEENKDDLNSKTNGESVFPLLLKMDLLSNDLKKLNQPMTFVEFRSLIAKQSMHPATMLIADVAILMWLVDEIRERSNDFLVEVDPPVLEALCALSMYSEFEKHCTADLFIVLSEVYMLIILYIPDDYFFSIMNIIKQLDDRCLIRKKLEEITYRLFDFSIPEGNKKLFLMCRTLLGVEHDFVKSIEKRLSSAGLTALEALYGSIANKFELHSLDNPCSIALKSGNCLEFTINCATFMSARVIKDTIKWDDELKYSKKIAFASNANRRACMIFILSRLQLPASVVSEIKSCTDWNQLIKLRRLGLTYGMTILRTAISPVSW